MIGARGEPTSRSSTGSLFAPGLSLIELLATMALLGIAVLMTIPTVASMRSEGRTAAAAREMAMTFHALRWRAVAQNRHHGLFFDSLEEGWAWFVVRDGNGNGLRTSEVRSGTDETLSGPHRMEDRMLGVGLGFPGDSAIPRIPPRRGVIEDLEDPVKFGRSNLVSFSPLGSSSSGTLYVSDRSNKLYGVVLFGPTARIRVWRFDVRERRWKL
jgi:prepilin-type N-terminal cleavage/methylation domain-containing protein